MKLLKTALITTAFAALTAAQSQAQITMVPENDQFSLKLIGRTNFDFGSYFEEHGNTEHADNGVAVNDTRLGVAGKFLDKWDYKIEICFDKKAISFRDVLIKYNFNSKHHLQFGNFFMPYGMKPLGLAYKFIDDATVDNALCPSRRMGVAYLLTTDHFNFTGGIFSDGNIDDGNAQFDKGLNLVAKAIYRPIINETTVLHFGLAPNYVNSPNAGSFGGVVPETFTTEGRKTLSDGFNAPHYSRYEAEMIFIQKRFLLEMHYQGAACEPRSADDRYHLGGFLAQTSFLLIGEQQNYNKATGLCQNASAKNLELLARYDYLDLHAGGHQSDFTIGLNYFFSKHFNMKLNYAYTKAEIGDAENSYNTIQVRAQFSF
jgi:phosphate-selective porin OprO/OprP